MNEEPIVEQEEVSEPSTENISAADGGETTTPDEVAKLLNLPAPEKVEEEEPEEPETPEAPVEPEEPIEPEKPVVAEPEKAEVVADGPKTFTLEIEDANGEKLTLDPDADLEEALKDFEPKNNGQIFKILDDIHKLRTEKSEYEADKTTKAEEAARAESIAKIQDGWDAEIKSLQGDKRISVSADGKEDPKVAEVFKFMGEENAKRMEAGRPTINSFEDALDKLELRESKAAEVEKAKEAKELARKRGGVVGGSSAPATSGAPVYRGGARTANEAIQQMGLIKK